MIVLNYVNSKPRTRNALRAAHKYIRGIAQKVIIFMVWKCVDAFIFIRENAFAIKQNRRRKLSRYTIV